MGMLSIGDFSRTRIILQDLPQKMSVIRTSIHLMDNRHKRIQIHLLRRYFLNMNTRQIIKTFTGKCLIRIIQNLTKGFRRNLTC